MKDGRDVIEAAKAHLAADPVANMLDDIAGKVLAAADRVEAAIGPMDEREYAAVVALLADRAVMQMAMTSGRLARESGESESECPIGCTCIYCVPGA